MVYAGLGWIIWMDQEHLHKWLLHKDLIFELHYLGSVEYSFNLHFSRPAAPALAHFINHGYQVNRNVMVADLAHAPTRVCSRSLSSTLATSAPAPSTLCASYYSAARSASGARAARATSPRRRGRRGR
ncbi:hypothetical protein A4X03_0g8851 [Tilletia caries]|nr:hypothetical protein A4X03_0g8851 [Tilletia caries]